MWFFLLAMFMNRRGARHSLGEQDGMMSGPTIEKLERRGGAFYTRVTFPDGSVYLDNIGAGAFDGDRLAPWMERKAKEHAEPPRDLDERPADWSGEDADDGLIVSAYKVDPRIIHIPTVYSIEPPGAARNDSRARGRHFHAIKAQCGTLVAYHRGALVSDHPLDEAHASRLHLHQRSGPVEHEHIEALVKAAILRQLKVDGYRINGRGDLLSDSPIIEIDGYQLHRRFNLRVRKLAETLCLQVATSTAWTTTASLAAELAEGRAPGFHSRYRYGPTGSTFYVHEVAEGVDVLSSLSHSPFAGRSVLQYLEEEHTSDSRWRWALRAVKDSGASPLVRGDFQWQKHRSKPDFEMAAVLLRRIIGPGELPKRVNDRFRTESHLAIANRFERFDVIREGLAGTALDAMISPVPASATTLSLESAQFNGRNLLFGRGRRTGWEAGDVFESLNNGHCLRPLRSDLRIGVITGAVTDQKSGETLRESLDVVRKLSDGHVEDVWLDVWDGTSMPTRGRVESWVAEHRLDGAFIAFERFDEDLYARWKRCLAFSDVPSQVAVVDTLCGQWAAFTLGLGLAAKLGAMGWTLADMRCQVDGWIGLDVGRRTKISFGGSSVVLDANGLLIGWQGATPTEGEAFERDKLRELIDGAVAGIMRERGPDGAPVRTLALLRDGRMWHNREVLEEIAAEQGTELIVCEVRKTGAFRLAQRQSESIGPAPAGQACWHEDTGWGWVQATVPNDRLGSPQPFQIHRIMGEVSMEDLCHDLFWLSKLHVGSTKQPGIPVPVHYAHKIADFATRDIISGTGWNTKLHFL